MSIVNVTTATSLDTGSNGKIRVTNLGSVNVTINPFGDAIVPGHAKDYYTQGAAVTGTSADATSQPVEVVALTINTADDTYVSRLPHVNVVAAAGATYTIPDVTTGPLHDITMSASVTFAFPTAAAGKTFKVLVHNDGTHTVTWPTVKWAGASAPTMTSGAGKTDLYEFWCFDGTNWVGRVLADVR